MLDNVFQRRREIERMLLSGKTLTIAELMGIYGVSKNAIRRDFDIINAELPLVSKRGNGGGYYLMKGPTPYQNTLSLEQLRCLKELILICSREQEEIILSIMREFGPYYLELFD